MDKINSVIRIFFVVFGAVYGMMLAIVPSQASIVINEIMYNPASINRDEEYLELYNPDSEIVNLSGWSIQKGINFYFPVGTSIPAEGYIIVSPSPAFFQLADSELKVVGPWSGHLSNDGELIELRNANGIVVDGLMYGDEQGWPQEADGNGSSLERINWEMPGSRSQSWRAGPVGGTPGRININAIANPKAIVTEVWQNPTVPTSSESVKIYCQVFHVRPIDRVVLWYKEETDTVYEKTTLFDDGIHEDGAANDGVYGGAIPAQSNKSIVEFAIEVIDAEGESGWFPIDGLKNAAIYLVDDTTYQPTLPFYRIVMRAADNKILRSRSVYSNDLLPSTFIYGDEIWYNAKVRFRGKGSRGQEPKSYRVDFTNSKYFHSIRKMNLNAIEIYHQYVGLECFKYLGMPVPEKQFVSLAFNQTYVPAYIQIERTDQYMMARLFGDGSGNLYRGIERGEFDYRGEDPTKYQANYEKQTNEREGDYTDIIRLSDLFSNTPDDCFVAELGNVINIQQWIRWFAIKQILNDMEGGLSYERGDDYYIYKNPADNLFYILPWDQDSVLERPIQSIHHHKVIAVQRLLRNPDLARFYYAELKNILDKELTQEAMDAIIDRTVPVTSEKTIDEMKQISREIRASIYASIPLSLTVEAANTPAVSAPLITNSELWRFHRGKTPPSPDWNQNGFDDSGWETGPAGFGYGDNDDQTVLGDMQGNYSSVFIRKTFHIVDPATVDKLLLTAIVDDGFVAYINGVEIARFNVTGEPLFESFADSSKEAGSPLQFEYGSASAILVPGTNTLAVVGLNNSLDSSDLSLSIRLDGFFTQGSQTVLKGLANAVQTRWVRVNGVEAQYTPWLASWTHPLDLPKGRTLIHVDAVNSAGQVFESTKVVFYVGTTPSTDGRETMGDEVWTPEHGDIQCDQNIIVYPGDTLTIEPGVNVRMAPAAGIIVYGTLTVNGTVDNPVVFLSQSTEKKWGSIAIDNASGTIRIVHADLSQAGTLTFRGKTYPAAVSIENSTAAIEGCYFTGSAQGIEAHHSYLTVRNNQFKDMGEMVHCTTCFTLVENNRFDHTIGYSDAIDFDGELGSGSEIRGNVILASEDDGIDMGDASPLIEGNWIENCFNKGISLEGKSNPVLRNNVIWKCDIGVASKDRCHALISQSTIVSCTTGVSVYQKNAGKGGGEAEIVNSVIWDTTSSLLVDALSSVVVRHSDLMQLPAGYEDTNLSLNPVLTDSTQGDFIPSTGSPLIDAGEDADIQSDFLGKPRPIGSAPDIGAYEVQQNTRISDWNLF